MKNKTHITSSREYFRKNLLNCKVFRIPNITITFLSIVILGCSDFVEVGPPKNILVSETVFNNAATVESAMANIYFKMREQGMVSGNFGITTGMGIYSDELDYYGFDAGTSQLYLHNVLPSNEVVTGW